MPRRRRFWGRAVLAAVVVIAVVLVAGGATVSNLTRPEPTTVAAKSPEPMKISLSGFHPSASVRMADSALVGASRSTGISRSLDRLASTRVTGHRWSTARLDLYLAPTEHATVRHVFPASRRIATTGHTEGAFSQVVVDDQPRWVHTDYLAAHRPRPSGSSSTSGSSSSGASATGPLVFRPCPATASVEHGLVPGAVRAWEAVCNRFPQVSTYGGLAPRSEHDTGHAVDAMVYGDTATGYQIAHFLQAHAAELDLYDIIYRQHIWTPVRASEGWRLMPDRGSPTANHMDHVHFAVN
ncbi:MAG: hypothetical protein ACRDPH_06395 [Marmoricola sp.]